jgi:hypothetical protein
VALFATVDVLDFVLRRAWILRDKLNIPGILTVLLGALLYSVASAVKGSAPRRQRRGRVPLKK